MEKKRTYGVWAVRSSTSIFGPAQSWCKENGKPLEFDTKAAAENYVKTEGDFPRYGNDDERADEIAVWLLREFMRKLRNCHTYRDSEPTTSILTITSNVVYGKD